MEITSARSLRFTALALLAAVHGCSSDSPTTPDTAQPASLAAVLAEASQPAVEAAGASLSGTRLPLPPAALLAPSGCAYDGSSRSFICPQITSGGVTIDRSYTLYDEAGNKQAEFSASTAAVQTTSHVSGTLTLVSSTITIDYTDDRTVSGLRTAKHVLNGTSISKMDGSFGGGGLPPMASSSSSTAKIENLVLPSASNRWPGPGTMTSDNTMSFGAHPPTSSHMVAVFNGTRCVAVTFTSDGFSETMTIDLSGRSPAGSCTP